MVFSLEWLAHIREWEIDRLAPLLPPGGAVLDVGAGTGQQSRLLAERGFRVTAIDLAASGYAAHLEYPVQDLMLDGQYRAQPVLVPETADHSTIRRTERVDERGPELAQTRETVIARRQKESDDDRLRLV